MEFRKSLVTRFPAVKCSLLKICKLILVSNMHFFGRNVVVVVDVVVVAVVVFDVFDVDWLRCIRRKEWKKYQTVLLLLHQTQRRCNLKCSALLRFDDDDDDDNSLITLSSGFQRNLRKFASFLRIWMSLAKFKCLLKVGARKTLQHFKNLTGWQYKYASNTCRFKSRVHFRYTA